MYKFGYSSFECAIFRAGIISNKLIGNIKRLNGINIWNIKIIIIRKKIK